MTKTSGHYTGWVKRDSVHGGYTTPIGQTTTDRGFKIVKFVTPRRIDNKKLTEALESGQFANGERVYTPRRQADASSVTESSPASAPTT